MASIRAIYIYESKRENPETGKPFGPICVESYGNLLGLVSFEDVHKYHLKSGDEVFLEEDGNGKLKLPIKLVHVNKEFEELVDPSWSARFWNNKK